MLPPGAQGAAARSQRGARRATLEDPLRPNAVHPVTRKNTMTNTGRHLPAMHLRGTEARQRLSSVVMEKGRGAGPFRPRPCPTARQVSRCLYPILTVQLSIVSMLPALSVERYSIR